MNIDLETLLAYPALSRVATALRQTQREAIRILPDLVSEDTLPLGANKFGGLPDLPPELDWPVATLRVPPHPADAPPPPAGLPTPPPDGRLALPFIAQLQLSTLAPFDRHALLPPAGRLFFFYNPVAYYLPVSAGSVSDMQTGVSYGLVDWGTPAQWRVLYVEREDSELRRTEPPLPLPEDVRYGTCALSFANEPTLPHVETSFIGSADDASGVVVLSEDEWSVYADLHYEWRANHTIHQLLGHADQTQPGAMEGCYLRLRGSLFPESSPWEQLSDAAQQQELTEGRLLLQVDEAPNGMRFGRDGRLFFFVRERDLAARDFGRVWVAEQ